MFPPEPNTQRPTGKVNPERFGGKQSILFAPGEEILLLNPQLGPAGESLPTSLLNGRGHLSPLYKFADQYLARALSKLRGHDEKQWIDAFELLTRTPIQQAGLMLADIAIKPFSFGLSTVADFGSKVRMIELWKNECESCPVVPTLTERPVSRYELYQALKEVGALDDSRWHQHFGNIQGVLAPGAEVFLTLEGSLSTLASLQAEGLTSLKDLHRTLERLTGVHSKEHVAAIGRDLLAIFDSFILDFKPENLRKFGNPVQDALNTAIGLTPESARRVAMAFEQVAHTLATTRLQEGGVTWALLVDPTRNIEKQNAEVKSLVEDISALPDKVRQNAQKVLEQTALISDRQAICKLFPSAENLLLLPSGPLTQQRWNAQLSRFCIAVLNHPQSATILEVLSLLSQDGKDGASAAAGFISNYPELQKSLGADRFVELLDCVFSSQDRRDFMASFRNFCSADGDKSALLQTLAAHAQRPLPKLVAEVPTVEVLQNLPQEVVLDLQAKPLIQEALTLFAQHQEELMADYTKFRFAQGYRCLLRAPDLWREYVAALVRGNEEDRKLLSHLRTAMERGPLSEANLFRLLIGERTAVVADTSERSTPRSDRERVAEGTAEIVVYGGPKNASRQAEIEEVLARSGKRVHFVEYAFQITPQQLMGTTLVFCTRFAGHAEYFYLKELARKAEAPLVHCRQAGKNSLLHACGVERE